MHDSQTDLAPGGMSRRTLLKGAAWSLPVIAVAVSSPTASASPGTATVEWTSGAATLLSLRALSTGDVLALDVLPSAPTDFRITNTPGIIPNVTAIFDVRQTTTALGISVPIGNATLRGFAPLEIPGDSTAIVSRPTLTSRRVLDGLTGDVFATDTLTTVAFGDVPSNATLSFGDIVWGVSAKSGISVDVDVLATFSVVVTFLSNGVPFGSLSGVNITVPVGAGLI